MEPALEPQTAIFTADATYGPRFVNAVLRRYLTRGAIPVALPLVWIGLFLVTAPRGASDVVGFVVAVVLSAAVVVAGLRWRVRRQCAPLVQPGAVLGARVDGDGLWISTPASTGTIAYSALQSARTEGTFVIIRVRRSSQFVMAPRELFPGTALEELQARIAAAAPARG